MKSKDWKIRLRNYRKNGYIKQALQDKSATIRYEAYQALGYIEKALQDNFIGIRLRAYQRLRNKYKERLLCERKNPRLIQDVLNYWKKNDN